MAVQDRDLPGGRPAVHVEVAALIDLARPETNLRLVL
jgi:hypothetical protein